MARGKKQNFEVLARAANCSKTLRKNIGTRIAGYQCCQIGVTGKTCCSQGAEPPMQEAMTLLEMETAAVVPEAEQASHFIQMHVQKEAASDQDLSRLSSSWPQQKTLCCCTAFNSETKFPMRGVKVTKEEIGMGLPRLWLAQACNCCISIKEK